MRRSTAIWLIPLIVAVLLPYPLRPYAVIAVSVGAIVTACVIYRPYSKLPTRPVADMVDDPEAKRLKYSVDARTEKYENQKIEK